MKRPVALAGAIGAAASVVVYVVLRVIGAYTSVPTDPRGMYWTEHAGFSWRLLTALVFGVLLSLTVAQVNAERTDRVLLPAIIVATVAIVLQTLYFP